MDQTFLLSTFHILTHLMFTTTKSYEVDIMIIPSLQVRKERHQKVEKLAKGNLAEKVEAGLKPASLSLLQACLSPP